MNELDHPNVITIYETYIDKYYYHFVMEYCDGGDLFEMIKKKDRLSENDAAYIIDQLLSAVSHCHYKKICHRDLKPENIVFKTRAHDPSKLNIDKGELEVKIIDFGLAKYQQGHDKLCTKVGTPYYVSPEVLEGNYDLRCDLWAIGVIAYTLLIGYPPFMA